MDSGTIRTVMATININLKWHHLNRNNWHHPTEMAGTIRTVVSSSTSRSPKWLFIDELNRTSTDFADISQKLKEYLIKDNIIQRKWKEVDTASQMNAIIQKLRKQEKNLLPWKKKRALEIGEKLLRQHHEKIFKADALKQKASKLLEYFNPELDTNDYIDFDHFADLWLSILVPELDKLKNTRTRKRKVFTLRDLTVKQVRLTEQHVDRLMESCQFSNTLDEMISACIIGIAKAKDA